MLKWFSTFLSSSWRWEFVKRAVRKWPAGWAKPGAGSFQRQQGRTFIMKKMQTVLVIMYQSRIIIHLLTPQGLLKRLLKLCIKDIKRVLRRLLFSAVFVAWQAQCVCLCGCPSALLSLPATLDPVISSFNSTGIFSNYFIACWLKKIRRIFFCILL